MITEECRRESHEKVDKQKRYNMILNCLSDKEMTSREIAYALGFKDLNAVKPRLTELEKTFHKVEVIGKKKDFITGVNVSIYRRVS